MSEVKIKGEVILAEWATSSTKAKIIDGGDDNNQMFLFLS